MNDIRLEEGERTEVTPPTTLTTRSDKIDTNPKIVIMDDHHRQRGGENSDTDHSSTAGESSYSFDPTTTSSINDGSGGGAGGGSGIEGLAGGGTGGYQGGTKKSSSVGSSSSLQHSPSTGGRLSSTYSYASASTPKTPSGSSDSGRRASSIRNSVVQSSVFLVGDEASSSNPTSPAPPLISEIHRRGTDTTTSTRTSKNISYFQTEKRELRFDLLDLVGREKEVATLKQCLYNVANKNDGNRSNSSSSTDCRELVLISGDSGTGKSALAYSLKESVLANNGLFVTGKFDLYLRDEPYIAISEACNDLCISILKLKEEKELNENEKEEEIHDGDDAVLTSRKTAASFEEIRDMIVQEMGDELYLLTPLIPQLRTVVFGTASYFHHQEDGGSSSNSQQQQQQQQQSSGTSDGRNRLEYAFRKFLAVVRLYFAPILILLDDLQWADQGSLNLLQSLITDSGGSSTKEETSSSSSSTSTSSDLMIVACYRSDEVRSNNMHRLSIFLRELQQQENKNKKNGSDDNDDDCNGSPSSPSFRITEIKIGNFTLPQITEMMMDLLYLDDGDDAKELIDLLYRRTRGNVFFLLRFLAMLAEGEFLTFQPGFNFWEWDIRRIEEETAATQNVVDLLKNKMSQLPKETALLLQLASCLGPSVDEDTICLVWHQYCESKKNMNDSVSNDSDEADKKKEGRQNAVSLLSQAVQDSFLERTASTGASQKICYYWVHDSIQEAAMCLIPKEELESTKFHVGEILVENLGEDELEAYKFVAVNLLNNPLSDQSPLSKRVQLSKLNLEAARKAQFVSAFESAAMYAQRGIHLLPNDRKWTADEYYPTTLELYSIAAETESAYGNTEQAERCCNEVLQQERATTMEKLRAYHVLIKNKGCRNEAKEALDMVLEVLEQLGCTFPKSSFGRVIRLLFAIGKTKKIDPNPYINGEKEFDIMTDRRRIECMKLLDAAATYSYMSENFVVDFLVILRLVRWTFRYGVTEFSPPGFATYAVLLGHAFGDVKGASLYSDLARRTISKYGMKSTECRTALANSFVDAWIDPFAGAIKQMLNGHDSGVKRGDTENACWCLFYGLILCLYDGVPLDSVREYCSVYVPHMEILKREDAAAMSSVCWQTVLNLMGQSDNTTTLTGLIIDEDMYTEKYQSAGIVYNVVPVLKSYLCAYFGEYELGADLALKRGDSFLKLHPGSNMLLVDPYVRGVCLYAMARKTQERKYKSQATKTRTLLQSWVIKGMKSIGHYLALLEAEHAALCGKKQDDVVQLYGEAITLTSSGQFPQDTALAHERAADYLVGLGEREKAKVHFEKAIEGYGEWGATRKVKMLQDQLGGKQGEVRLSLWWDI